MRLLLRVTLTLAFSTFLFLVFYTLGFEMAVIIGLGMLAADHVMEEI